MNDNKVILNCPKCNGENHIEIINTVNVTQSPEMKEKVLGLEMFTVNCDKCDAKISIDYPFLYHDSLNKFMVYYLPEDDDATVNEINKKLNSDHTIDEEIRGIYIMRIVRELNDLKEKIFILESGKNDITVELYKSLVLTRLREDSPEFIPTEALYTPSEKILIFGQDGSSLSVKIDENAYENLQNDIGEVIGDTFGKGFLQVDYDWIIDKFYN